MLVFIDADTILPKYFIQSFENRVNEKHFQAGSFTQKMDSDNLAIRAGAHFMSGYMRLMQYTPWPIGFGCYILLKRLLTQYMDLMNLYTLWKITILYFKQKEQGIKSAL